MKDLTKKLLIVVFIVTAKLFSDMVFSLQGPFYPREAQSKNATAVEIGLVFGAYEVGAVIFGPFAGMLIPKLNLRWTIVLNNLAVGISAIIFGFLDLLSSRTLFILFGCLCRLVESIGSIGNFVCVNSYVVCEFEGTKRALLLGIVDSFLGVAATIGPAAGGLLYQIGGFHLPFEVTGWILVLLGFLSVIVLKGARFSLGSSDSSTSRGILTLLKIGPITMCLCATFVNTVGFGFLITLLEIRLRLFSLSAIEVGLVFFLFALFFSIFSPISCHVANKLGGSDVLVPMCGAIICSISFFLIGTPPIVGLDPSATLTITCVVFIGIGSSMNVGSTLVIMMKASVASGHKREDSQVTFQLTTIWVLSQSLALLFSPIISGALYDQFEFVNATLFPFLLNVLMVFYFGVYICLKGGDLWKRNKSEWSETTPLKSQMCFNSKD